MPYQTSNHITKYVFYVNCFIKFKNQEKYTKKYCNFFLRYVFVSMLGLSEIHHVSLAKRVRIEGSIPLLTLILLFFLKQNNDLLFSII